jgi:hypothetical protein
VRREVEDPIGLRRTDGTPHPRIVTKINRHHRNVELGKSPEVTVRSDERRDEVAVADQASDEVRADEAAGARYERMRQVREESRCLPKKTA